MKSITIFLLLPLLFMACQNKNAKEYKDFDHYPVYKGNDLGMMYTPAQSMLKVWSPTASALTLRLYDAGDQGKMIQEIQMKQADAGVWEAKLIGDIKGSYYTVQAQIGDKLMDEVPDPYARAVGVNGKRAMVIDLSETNPENWAQDTMPALVQATDIVLYELHIRDLSIHPNSGIKNTGKFLGLTETGTKSPDGLATGLDHLKEMGITHLHLLPAFDFASIDELKLDQPQFNWGYDPLNYNTPEGSYSTNPFDGSVRIKEFKQMVKALHENGIRVVMDVVYNHTRHTEKSYFNQLVPGYYYRQNADGSFSNASACGNETASERPMMRKFMVESLKYWAQEYHIDGFRFDLMGIHDIETMNLIAKELRQINPGIFLYGEGWTAGPSPLPESQQALKKHTYLLDDIAAFSDDIRDGIKGSWHDLSTKGFASGDDSVKEYVRFGIVGATFHPDIDMSAIPNIKEAWAKDPGQAINYVSCHDNHTLWDRITLSNGSDSEATRMRMAMLANTIVLTAQGVPFLHAGEEMLRTKGGEGNSYNKPDSVNRIDWSRKAKYPQLVDLYKRLIAMRKNHPAFRMSKAEQVQEALNFIYHEDPQLIGYSLDGEISGDAWKEILVFYNGSHTAKHAFFHSKNWKVVLENHKLDEEKGLRKFNGSSIDIPPYSATILASYE